MLDSSIFLSSINLVSHKFVIATISSQKLWYVSPTILLYSHELTHTLSHARIVFSCASNIIARTLRSQ